MTDFEESSKRSLVIQISEVIEQIIDGYKDKEKRISHWVQKDGIQNCWDARKDPENRKKNWTCEIELHENGTNSIVTITDFGTWGLTGKRLEKEDLMKDQPPEERWCRFENYAFTHKSMKTQHLLGSRGRGKFVFSGASQTKITLYDTLRDDKVYRLGKRAIEKLDAPNWLEEGQKAKEILDFHTHGMIAPLTHVGARIIILNPAKELVDDIKDGHMEQFISETWWEIIKKGAKIIVKNGTTSNIVKPFTESLPCSTMTSTKIHVPLSSEQKVFIKESIPIENTKFKIKRLYILYDPLRAFDDRQLGISVQRGGMSITHYDTRELGSVLSDHITGYVVLEEGFQDEMRLAEGPEHYSYNWNTKPAVNLAWMLKKLYRKFATDQLGWKENKSAQESKSDKKANERAINKANEIAKKMGFGKGGGPKGGPPRIRGPLQVKKLIEVQLDDLGFPNPNTERVNYGESITKIDVRVINTTDKDIKVGIKIEIRSVDRDEQVYGKYLYTNASFSSEKKSESAYYGGKSLKIEKNDFPPGQYKVKASIALITPILKFRKGQELDISLKSFFVEVDPPNGGIWEEIIAADFSNFEDEIKRTRKAYHEDGSRGNTYVLKYNKDHASHKAIKDNDVTVIGQYRYSLTIPELCMIDLENQWNNIFTEDDKNQGIARIAEVMKNTIDKYTDSKYLSDV